MASDLCSQVPNPHVFRVNLSVRGNDRTEPVCQLVHITLFRCEDPGLTGELPPGWPQMTDKWVNSENNNVIKDTDTRWLWWWWKDNCVDGCLAESIISINIWALLVFVHILFVSFLCLLLFCTWTWMRAHVQSSILIPIHHPGLLLPVTWCWVTITTITLERAARVRAI